MDATTIVDEVKKVTAKWTKQRKAEHREYSRVMRRREALVAPDRVTVKDAAWKVMEQAYLKASSGGTLPAHARQVMYAARGDIQEMTGRTLNDQYFTQTLLPDYLNETKVGWDVVFDARGHLHEPHTKKTVALGTIEVRQYLHEISTHTVSTAEASLSDDDSSFPTCGPGHRFGAIMFVEKEGFMPLFRAVKLGERFDIAIMSTKGLSVTASRSLVDELCDKYDIPLLVVHDFDKSGFSIVGTLQRDTRRYEFLNDIEVVDLGLRLADVKANNLQSESAYYGKTNPKWNLQENGATDEEIAFLAGDGYPYRGKRVELNAFTSGDLIAWLESKLKEQGIEKVIPDAETLETAYHRAVEITILNGIVEKAAEQAMDRCDKLGVPDDIEERVWECLKDNPSLTWDAAVAELAEESMEADSSREP